MTDVDPISSDQGPHGDDPDDEAIAEAEALGLVDDDGIWSLPDPVDDVD